MSTEKEQQSLRLVRTDARFKEVQSAYHHLYMWLRAGVCDVDHDRYTIFKREGWTLHCTMMCSIATYGNEKMTEELEYLDGKGHMVYTLENLGIEEFLDIVFLTTGKV